MAVGFRPRHVRSLGAPQRAGEQVPRREAYLGVGNLLKWLSYRIACPAGCVEA